MNPWLRLIRLPLAPTAICDSLACGALAYATAGLGVTDPFGWAALAATSFFLYCFGMATNDFADRKVDRLKNPDRPLPSGAVSVRRAQCLVVLLAILAVIEPGIGHRSAALTGIGLILTYNFLLKHFVVPGACAMGLVRFFNASLAVWPLVLSGDVTWVLLVPPACIGLYSGAVTLFSTTEDEEAPRRVVASRILAAMAFAGAATAAWIVGGLPTMGVVVAFGVASSTLFGRTPRPGPRKRQVLEMLLGLYWLAFVIASGAHGGDRVAWVVLSLAGLPVAWGLAIASQLMVRWLRPR